MHPEVKERLKIAASEYDENPGVLLGYILREYYETNGWGYSIEAVGQDTASAPGVVEDKPEEPNPTSRREKKELICERVEPDPNGTIRGGDLRDLIGEIAGETVVDDYLPSILDRLAYVHHPKIYGLYIPQDDLTDYGLTTDDPAIDRKPYEALDRSEKIEGMKEKLRRGNVGLSVRQIHEQVFDGNGSTSHIRQLVHTVAESDGFAYRKTPGGKKVLRWVGSSAPAAAAATDGGCQIDADSDSAPNPERDPPT